MGRGPSGSSALSPRGSRRIGAAGRRWCRARRRDPRVVPERRLARPRRDARGCGDLFIRYGGHAGAAGFEIAAERWAEFVERFGARADAAPPRPATVLRSTSPCRPSTSTTPSPRSRAPRACGPGNPEPLVAVLGLTVTRVRAPTGGHSQLTLKRRLDVLDGIAFGRSDIAEVVREGDRLDVVARLTSRRFGGYESLQLDIRDVALSGAHPEAAALLGTEAAHRLPVRPHDAPGARRSAARRRPLRDGIVGSLLAPRARDRRPADRRDRHHQPAQRPAPVRTRSNAGRQRRDRQRRAGPHARAIERRRRPDPPRTSRRSPGRSPTPRRATSGSRRRTERPS